MNSERRWPATVVLLCVLFALCGVLALLRPNFLTWANLINVLRQTSINGILAVGVTFVLLTGGVDLSLGSVVALTGVVAALCASGSADALWMPAGAGVLSGALCGVANGFVISFGRVASFIVTLGMMTTARGLGLVLSRGMPVSNLGQSFCSIGSAYIGGIPVPVLLFSGVALTAGVVLANTRYGRHTYALGGNERAARAAGVRVRLVKTLAYVVSGACAGLAGVVLAARITTGQPNSGIGYELDAIAAVVIGGTSLSGGVGTVGGTVLGVLLMGVLNNGLDLLNVSPYYQQILKGIIIIAAVWIDRARRHSET